MNNEDESVLISMPKATTDATPYSDVGDYEISVNNGVAENYDFTYIGGKLSIEKAYQTLTWEQDLSKIKQFDQIELTAEASSGLDITYTIEGDPICTITKIGKKQILDCTGIGEVVIVAIQNGDKNYWQTTKIYKPVVIWSAAGIDSISTYSSSDVKIYDISGNRISKLQKGVNILKMSNGKKRKIVVK